MSAYYVKKVRWADIETQKELEGGGAYKRKVLHLFPSASRPLACFPSLPLRLSSPRSSACSLANSSTALRTRERLGGWRTESENEEGEFVSGQSARRTGELQGTHSSILHFSVGFKHFCFFLIYFFTGALAGEEGAGEGEVHWPQGDPGSAGRRGWVDYIFSLLSFIISLLFMVVVVNVWL